MDSADACRSDDRSLYGLRVASEVPAPDLPSWTGDDRAPDLTILLGEAPPLAHAVVDRPLLQIGADGQCRFTVRGVAAYLVSPDGRAIVVAPEGEADRAEVRAFLFGSVLAIVCMRRGLLPLHAACVRIGDKAVAIAGQSGAGKSTLAANLLRRGFPMLADDVTVVDLSAGTPLAMPAFPRVKLWRDAMNRLELPVDGLERARPTLEKYHVPVEEGFCATPTPLAGLVHLEPDPKAPMGLRRLGAMEGLARIGSIVYRQPLMVRLGLRDQQMDQFLRLAAALGGVRALRRPETPAELDAVVPLMSALAS